MNTKLTYSLHEERRSYNYKYNLYFGFSHELCLFVREEEKSIIIYQHDIMLLAKYLKAAMSGASLEQIQQLAEKTKTSNCLFTDWVAELYEQILPNIPLIADNAGMYPQNASPKGEWVLRLCGLYR